MFWFFIILSGLVKAFKGVRSKKWVDKSNSATSNYVVSIDVTSLFPPFWILTKIKIRCAPRPQVLRSHFENWFVKPIMKRSGDDGFIRLLNSNFQSLYSWKVELIFGILAKPRQQIHLKSNHSRNINIQNWAILTKNCDCLKISSPLPLPSVPTLHPFGTPKGFRDVSVSNSNL